MAVRTLAQLKRSQAQLLDAYKQQQDGGESQTVPAGGIDGLQPATLMIGKVDEVVTSDATYGPHLKIVLQRFSDVPPGAADAYSTRQVYYPAPGRSVADYTTGTFVLLIQAGGGRFAVGV